MIVSINDIIKHRQAALLEYPAEAQEELREEVVFTNKGCHADDLLRLKTAIPDLPDSFLDVLSTVSLYQKGLLGIELSPGPARLSYVDQIIYQNQTALARDSVYTPIGHKDADLILLQRSSFETSGGGIFFLRCNQRQTISYLAPALMEFLLICANMEDSFPRRGMPIESNRLAYILDYFGSGVAAATWEYLIRS